MTSKTAGILGFLGFILTAFGLGGVEHSLSDADLFGAMVVSTVGLLIMYAAVMALKVSDYYDRDHRTN